MKIAVLSGKGGTGKTFVSVNLAVALGTGTYVDCDVEEPNGRLFFKPQITERKKVTVTIPAFRTKQCTGCRKCVEFCAFHALAFVKKEPMLFQEVCHSCGGCQLVCEHQAITTKKRHVGDVLIGTSKNIHFLSGKLNIGEASGVPIIKELLANMPKQEHVVIDCPPGSGCMVMESIKEADYCILVAEPTEFGRYNMEMIYELLHIFHKPMGVVLNKYMDGENPSKEFCEKHKIEILSNIPFDLDIGKQIAEGKIVSHYDVTIADLFTNMSKQVAKKVH